MDARIKQLNSRIDRLEAEFERNRQQLLHLSDENRRGTSDYDTLLERNLRINDEIQSLLTAIWKLEEQQHQ
jgi:hypothetical protein